MLVAAYKLARMTGPMTGPTTAHAAWRITWLIAILVLVTPVCSFGHELEDGQVKRSNEVIVRNDRLFVKYTLGANDKTLGELYTKITGKEPNADVKTLLSEFENEIAAHVAGNLSISWSDQKVTADSKSVRQTDKHHERFVVELEFPLEESPTFAVLKISDAGFEDFEGDLRLAFRTRGNTLMIRSNVAAVIARAKPVDLTKLSAEKRLDAAKIEAKIKVAKKQDPS